MTGHLELMKKAIDYADKHQTPFGALIHNGYDSFITSNTSKEDGKVYHAEMNAFLNIPSDFKKDLGLTLYTTCEPCVMCMGAAMWNSVERIYFGVSIDTASNYLSQIKLYSRALAKYAFHNIFIEGGLLEEACEELFKKYTGELCPA